MWKVTNLTDKTPFPKRVVERDGVVRVVMELNPVNISFYAEDGKPEIREFGISTGLTEVGISRERVGVHNLKPGESVMTNTKPTNDPRLLIEAVEEKKK